MRDGVDAAVGDTGTAVGDAGAAVGDTLIGSSVGLAVLIERHNTRTPPRKIMLNVAKAKRAWVELRFLDFMLFFTVEVL